PEVGVAALERPGPERLDLLVEAGRDARDLRARDPQPQGLDQLVDLARGDAADVGLLDDVQERLLTALAGLQEGGEVAALAQLRDLQVDLAGAGVPAPGAVAVAVGRPIRGALAPLRA